MLEVMESWDYKKWFDTLEDSSSRAAIDGRILMIRRLGRLAGDFKSVGSGVFELRINKGPGYRVYVSIQGKTLLLLLLGGSKRRQGDDIKRATKILAEWEAENG